MSSLHLFVTHLLEAVVITAAVLGLLPSRVWRLTQLLESAIKTWHSFTVIAHKLLIAEM